MSGRPGLLIVDDDADVRTAAELALAGHVGAVEAVAAPDAIGELEPGRFGCVLLDMNFIAGESSGRRGLDAIAPIRVQDPSLAVVLMTAYGGLSLAVEGLKRGAHDFILKPWRNRDLIAAVQSACAATDVARRGEPLDSIERRAIERTLAEARGNVAQAATALGLTRQALYRRMVKYGL